MSYGRPRYIHPAVFGIEQEIPLQFCRDEHGKIAPWRQLCNGRTPFLTGQLVDQHLGDFIRSYVKNQYKNKYLVGPAASGFFVPDGRVYADQSRNFEICTTECSDPFELAQHVNNLRSALHNEIVHQGNRIRAFNDTGQKGDNTTSFHENYYSEISGDRIDLTTFLNTLIPFMVTRSVMTGTGGPDSAGYMCLSPRMSHMELDISSSSTQSRGFFLLRDEAHAVDGIRVQAMSSDQIVSPLNIALQIGATAIAIRLAEHKLLPPTYPNWFERYENLNRQDLDGINDNFSRAVEYQRCVYQVAAQYAHDAKGQGLPSIFVSHRSVDQLLELWDERLTLLEQYLRNEHDLDTVAQYCEWAAKYALIRRAREKKNIPMGMQLTSSESWACAELNAFEPAREGFVGIQSRFTQANIPYEGDYTVPRASARAEYITHELAAEARKHDLVRKANWPHCEIARDNSPVFIYLMKEPFCGSREEVDYELTDFFGSYSRGSRRRISGIDLRYWQKQDPQPLSITG